MIHFKKNRKKYRKMRRDRWVSHKEEESKNNKKWQDNNVVHMIEWRKNYYGKNKNKIKLNYKKWVSKNMFRKLYLNAKRTRTMDKIIISKVQFNAILNMFDGGCCYCGEHKNRTIEHLIPVSKGGKSVYENLLLACWKCNSSKRDKDMEEWYRRQDFYNQDNLIKIKIHMGVDIRTIEKEASFAKKRYGT